MTVPLESDKPERVFLATTALEEFWDTTKPVVFLGEWCRRYSRKSHWQQLNARVLPDYWKNRADQIAAFDYLGSLNERLLESLTDAMNRLHGVQHEARFWRILLGPWLLYYLPVVYDRFLAIKTALTVYPALETIGISEDEYVIPQDFTEFMESVYDDSYNLQLYTRILENIGVTVSRRSLCITGSPADTRVHARGARSIQRSLKRLAYSIYQRLFRRAPIVLRDAYFTRAQEVGLMLLTFGKVRTDKHSEMGFPAYKTDQDRRAHLRGISAAAGNSEFEALVAKLIAGDMPHCYVEGFSDLGNKASRHYRDRPKAIFSANGWYFDEVFKLWAAISAEKGVVLAGAQHGGNYGSVRHIMAEAHERAIVDRFYTWGWHDTNASLGDSKAVAMPAPKLIGRKKINSSNDRDGVLFVSTTNSRYVSMHFPDSTADYCRYLEWQGRFASELEPGIRQKMRVRLLRDRGWDYALRWRDRFPEVALEGFQDRDFLSSLANCRLYVCDHLSTTFVEALAANKPTILFWNPEMNELRREAEPYYAKLRSSGVLYATPEEAAQAVNTVYTDVEAWWNRGGTQHAVQTFCARYALTRDNALRTWSRELCGLVKSVDLPQAI